MYALRLIALAAAAMLAACGGGGGGGGDTPPPVVPPVIPPVTPTNRAPVAVAGAAQAVMVGTAVMFDGSASSDPDANPITFDWQITARPAGSVAALVGSTTLKPAFTPDQPGAYTVRLVVSDGKLSSAASELTLTVTAVSLPPTAAGLYLQIGGISTFYSVDEGLGHVTPLPASCQAFVAADADPSGVVLAVSATEAAVTEVNPVTGQCRTKFATPVLMKAIAVASNGNILTVSAVQQFGQNVLYTFSPAGVLLSSGAMGGTSGSSSIGSLRVVEAIDFGPDGSLYAFDHGPLYVAGTGGPVVANKTRAWKLNPATGGGFIDYWNPKFESSGDVDIAPDGRVRAVTDKLLQSYQINGWTQGTTVTLDTALPASGGALVSR